MVGEGRVGVEACAEAVNSSIVGVFTVLLKGCHHIQSPNKLLYLLYTHDFMKIFCIAISCVFSCLRVCYKGVYCTVLFICV